VSHEHGGTAADEDDDDDDDAEDAERQADCQRYLVSVATVALRERIEQVEPARTVTRALERRKPVLCRVPIYRAQRIAYTLSNEIPRGLTGFGVRDLGAILLDQRAGTFIGRRRRSSDVYRVIRVQKQREDFSMQSITANRTVHYPDCHYHSYLCLRRQQ